MSTTRATASRIRGITAARKTLMRLVVTVTRYAERRAKTDEERAWAGGVLAHVQAALGVAHPYEANYPARPVRKRSDDTHGLRLDRPEPGADRG